MESQDIETTVSGKADEETGSVVVAQQVEVQVGEASAQAAKEPVEEFLKGIGVSPVVLGLVMEVIELAKDESFYSSPKRIKRVQKSLTPPDLEDRIKKQLLNAATKELDNKAMAEHRRTGKFVPVTQKDIEVRFQEKWDKHLKDNADKKVKEKAIAKVN